VTVNANGYSDPNCGQAQIIVIQHTAGQYSALSTSCTHACCPVTLSGSSLRCPCHGAVFDLTGKHVSGPGSGDLATLQVCADSCGVTVTIA
jgi:nitrite reductase/ring-hydroxylating ferredoxin subunit